MVWRWSVITVVALAFTAPARTQVPSPSDFHRTFTDHFASVNGIRIHYVIGGSGSPILLVHGFPETWYAWRKVMPKLAEHHTVIVPDLRGAGASERPTGPYDTGTMAEDLHQLVRQLGYDSIDVVGHDVGVAVSYPYAAAHRGEVRHLILLDVPPQGTAAFEKLRSKAWNWGFQAIPDMPETLVAGRERAYLDEGFYKPLSQNKAAISREDVDEYVRAYSAPGAMHAAFEWYRAFPEDIRQNRIQLRTKLEMPVLMLGGAQSGAPAMRETAREIAIRYEVGSVENCGHWMAEEQPDAVTVRILAFIDGPVPSAARAGTRRNRSRSASLPRAQR